MDGFNVIAIQNPATCETYIAIYADSQVEQLCQVAGRWAMDDDLSFSWYDAAVLMQKARRDQEKQADSKCKWSE